MLVDYIISKECKNEEVLYACYQCGNEESDKYSVPTFYDDTCEDWEERDD